MIRANSLECGGAGAHKLDRVEDGARAAVVGGVRRGQALRAWLSDQDATVLVASARFQFLN